MLLIFLLIFALVVVAALVCLWRYERLGWRSLFGNTKKDQSGFADEQWDRSKPVQFDRASGIYSEDPHLPL